MQTNGFLAYLVTQSLITVDLAETILAATQKTNCSIINYLIQNQLLPYNLIATKTAEYFGYDIIKIDQLNPDDLPIKLIDRKIMEKYQILPVTQKEDSIVIAIFDPTIADGLNEIRFHTNLLVKPVVAEYDKLINILNTVLYTKKQSETTKDDSQIINLVDQILNDAINRGASDVHLEPMQNTFRIRFRIDGMLHEIVNLTSTLVSALTTRIKIMASLNIAEKRLPQDGRFSLKIDTKNKFDCRVSSCPTLYGEKIVIRLLNSSQKLLKIQELGLDEAQLATLLSSIKKPQGLILVTGPTGSGKTVSLYAILNELNQLTKNIATVEDPVEINLPGINQVNINPKIGLNFATTLRTFLRQDPDIIMLGEIRDGETAEIAVKAAQTGHLVLATLHTNNAVESINRLLNMGIATFNLCNSLLLVIAQRLVRKLCPICKKNQNILLEGLLENGFNSNEAANLKIYEATGCDRCNLGYKGRLGIFELLAISEGINSLLLQHKNTEEIWQQARQEGMLTLRQIGLQTVKLGLTSLAEVNRVI